MDSLTKKSLFHVLLFMSHSRIIISHNEIYLEVIAIHKMYNRSSIESQVQYKIISDC